MKRGVLIFHILSSVVFVLILIWINEFVSSTYTNIIIGVVGGLIANFLGLVVTFFNERKKAKERIIGYISNLSFMLDNFNSFLVYVESLKDRKEGLSNKDLAIIFISNILNFNYEITKFYEIIDSIFRNNSFCTIDKFIIESFLKDLDNFSRRFIGKTRGLYLDSDKIYIVFGNLSNLKDYLILNMKVRSDSSGDERYRFIYLTLGRVFLYYAVALNELLITRKSLKDYYYYYYFIIGKSKFIIKNRVLDYIVKDLSLQNKEDIWILENILYSKGFRFGVKE